MTHVSPVSRILEFLAGCCLGWLYTNAESALSARSPHIGDILAVGLTGLSWVLYTRGAWPTGIESMKYAFLFLLPSLVLLWSIVRNGLLARILSTRVLIWIGNLSAYAFLIHGAMIACSKYFLGLAGVSDVLVVAACAVLSTFGLSVMWQHLAKEGHPMRKMGT